MDALTYEDLIMLINGAKASRERLVILHHNLHGLYMYLTNKEFQSAYQNASYAYVDGMPIIWFGKVAGFRVNKEHRITFLDCFDLILSESQSRNWRVFYLGSTPEVLDRGLTILREKYPRLALRGRDGYFSKSGSESDEVIDEINSFCPDILFVGMGMPTQELWLANYRDKIRAAAILTSGATLDYVTGHAYRPPAWVGNLGLYGVCRMFSDPMRLWRRYLVEPTVVAWYLLPGVLRQRFASRRRGAEVGTLRL